MPRAVPVHPVLATLLADWKQGGWIQMMEREPRPDDLIVPSRLGNNRSANHVLKKFHKDLTTLGLRVRRQHDLRRTFISLCLGDGASKDILRWITHAPEGDVVDDYTTLVWLPLCREVSKLEFSLPGSHQTPSANSAESLGRVTSRVTGPLATPLEEAQALMATEEVGSEILRGGRDLKLEARGTENPGGTRPWPVTPRGDRGREERFEPRRARPSGLALRRHGTPTARFAQCRARIPDHQPRDVTFHDRPWASGSVRPMSLSSLRRWSAS